MQTGSEFCLNFIKPSSGEGIAIQAAGTEVLEEFAPLYWTAYFQAVRSGYLPLVELGFGAVPLDTISADEGVLRKKKMFFEKMTEEDAKGRKWHLLVVRLRKELVGGGLISCAPLKDFACFSCLAIADGHEGKGYALALRYASLELVKRYYANVAYISIGRYAKSTEYARNQYGAQSFFNSIVRLATRKDEMLWEGERTTFYDVPVPSLEKLLIAKLQDYNVQLSD